MNKPLSKILVVEDEEIIRNSLVKLLERHNYAVNDAVSVKAAVSRYNIKEFNLIISDLRLPGNPGSELIKLAETVPVIIMTSYASLRSAVDIMRQGAADYISKPFDHEELIQSVKRALSNTAHNPDKTDNLTEVT
ncbi:MAG: response regulator, partial [Porticoccaceae bacterium]|nr:response regulator [Porticoccaceae bacterium]